MMLVLAAVLATYPVLRPAEAEGIHVEYLAPEHPRQNYWPQEERYEENVARAKRALSGVDSARLARLLRSVIDGREWREMPCYECIAAIELLGERGEPSAADVVEDVWEARASVVAGSDPSPPDDLRYFHAAVDAWVTLKLGNLHGAEALEWARRVYAMDERRRGIRWPAAVSLYKRERRRQGWSPAVMSFFDDPRARVRKYALWILDLDDPSLPDYVRDRVVLFLLDPDPEIRKVMSGGLFFGRRPAWIPAFVRFLNRPDATPAAREAIQKSLEVRGYVARRVDGRWVAEPKHKPKDAPVPHRK